MEHGHQVSQAQLRELVRAGDAGVRIPAAFLQELHFQRVRIQYVVGVRPGGEPFCWRGGTHSGGCYTACMARQTFWRIVRSDPPTEQDFQSNEARGRRPPDTSSDVARLWSGLSMYASEDTARATAQAFPRIGTLLAAVQIEDGDPVRVEKTLGHEHYTLWGEAALLLARVVRVVPVSD